MKHPHRIQPGSCTRRTLASSAVRLLGWRVLVGAILQWTILACPAQAKLDGAAEGSNWERLTECRLMTNKVVDGDSFHVMHKGREYVFRLYFVDAPESSTEFKDRIKDQAVFFGMSTNDIPRAGQLASRFTREKLTGKDITVVTRHQNAMGRGGLARYYGVVSVDGRNLAEELVANGLARIHGLRANWPDGSGSATFISKLKNLELNARQMGLGVWNRAAFPLETDAPSGTNATASATDLSPVVVDLNTATFDELLTLPGIGPKLAERIIAHRPYVTLKDFDDVPGIGPATVKRLERFIRISNPAQ